MKIRRLKGIWVCVLAIAVSGLFADEVPPNNTRPLSEIVKSVEDASAGAIAEAEFDDGRWEVVTVKDGRWTKFCIDPATAEVQQRRSIESDDDIPPVEGPRLSSIIKSLEDEKRGIITEVEFDDGYWEVEIRDNGKKVKLDIDAGTGKTVRTQDR